MTEPRGRRALLDAALVAALHALACALVRAAGFDHVSDDDFARVTIAQAFAHAPRLDPSRTSWLPFPFWVLGSAMIALGRSLAVARGVSIAVSSLAAAAPYLALRAAGARRHPALLGVAFATLSPWSLWLGATTVPESATASLAAAGVIALGARPVAHPDHADDDDGAARALPWFGGALLAACLSRYEPWPAAAVVAIALALRAARTARARGPGAVDRRAILAAAIVALGPLLWMLWNAHAHGSALHFFHRVSRFKRAIGEGSGGDLSALLVYPRLLVTSRPDVTVAAAGAALLLRRADVRARWLVPLLAALAELAFLSYGNLADGAPAHHAERALLGAFFLLAMFAGDVLGAEAERTLAGRHESRGARGLAAGGAALLAALWGLTAHSAWKTMPGRSTAEDRAAQVAEGTRLRETAGAGRVELTPCAYEHFALVAAFGAPERVDTLPAAPEGGACPRVVVR